MTLARYVRPLAAALSLVSLLAAPASAQVDLATVKQFFVFGDSLADTGNVYLTSKALRISPAPPPSESPHRAYFNGRFSNGPVFVEYLWQSISGAAPGTYGALRPYIAFPFVGSANSVNFAFGGTGTPLLDQTPGGLYAPGLKGQVELFRLALGGRPAPATALYLIATGANDYRSDAYNQPMPPDQVVGNIAASIKRLYVTGARKIVVLGLPDLGRLPSVQNPDEAMQASALTAAHNTMLQGALALLRSELPGVQLVYVDINGAFQVLPPNMNQSLPALAVLGEQTGNPALVACLFVNPSLCSDVPLDVQDQFLFWDIVHPTTAAHAGLGGYVLGRMQEPALATQ